MGQELSCPCNNNDSNVYFPPEDDENSNVTTMKVPDTPDTTVSTNLNTGASSASSTMPFDTPAVSKKSKSRKWAAASRDGPSGLDTSSTQRPGEDAIGDGEGHISREEMESALGNVRGELAFPEETSASEQERSAARAAHASMESEAMRAARAKQEQHNDRIVATFNSVMLADGLKVLKHHRRSSKKAASRVIRFVPDYGGALVWDKPLRQPGAKASRVPLDAINQVELEQRIVWISAGDERVGFETSKAEDADLMYQAICILVDRCHAA